MPSHVDICEINIILNILTLIQSQAIQRKVDAAGKTRAPRATQAEKAKARQLRAAGMSYDAIGAELGRGGRTIHRWCNPEEAEKERLRYARSSEQDRERKRANNRRYKKEFEHGRAALQEGFSFVGIELDKDYLNIANHRINHKDIAVLLF